MQHPEVAPGGPDHGASPWRGCALSAAISALIAWVSMKVLFRAAKEVGRGRVRVYEGADQAARHRHAELITVADLRHALAHDQLRPARQPIFALGDEPRIVRHEALGVRHAQGYALGLPDARPVDPPLS